ncbi:unnamed protein product [Brachionus calyciflorus]|uniref:Uncharacterized protein n=1 Tax=Brachionus calyciflorus TaxID=104777 RepID=A0A814N9B2_9BILA|nr:unnamed protein product [Brachionus calyciflorus]
MEILNENLLNPFVFANLKTIQVIGKLDLFDANLIINIPDLKYLSFDLYNLENFTRNLNWFSKLPRNLILNLNDRKKGFEFSDREFCLFKEFPQQNEIIPILKGKVFAECSCTIVWLIKNAIGNNLIKTPTIQKCFEDANFIERKFQQCNFEQKRQECKNQDSLIINSQVTNLLVSENLKTSSTGNIQDSDTKTNSVIKTMAILIGSVGFVTISAIMGLFLFISR